MSFARNLQVTQAKQRAVNDSISDFSARQFTVCGEILVNGVGESVVSVPFPVVFIERPLFHFGGVLDDNQTVTAGSYPTLSAVVSSFDVKRSGIEKTEYTGANIAITTTGVAEQRMVLCWFFVGKALVNPIGDVGNTDGTI